MGIKVSVRQWLKKEEKVSAGRLAVLISAITVSVLAVAYLGLAVFFQGHFVFRTTINGMKVSASSPKGVENKIEKQTDDYQLVLREREDKTEIINGNEIEITPVFRQDVQKLLEKQNGFAWPYYLFFPREYETQTLVSYDGEKLEERIAQLDCMDESIWTESESAEILDYGKDGYQTENAVYGTVIDKENMTKALEEAIEALQPEVDLEDSKCYEDPAVTEDDEVFKTALDTLNQYTGLKITYDVGKEPEVLDGETISTWLSVDEEYNAAIDEEAVLTYVKGLAKKYNTAYGSRTLDTSYGQQVIIYGGNYGWRIDNGAEQEMIIADLKEGRDVEREPVYLQTANSHGEKDYGDTYVEINLTAQHLFFYKDGALVVETDFVSGNLAKSHGTPTGSFGLTYKTKDATLRGEDYESKVSFWMPFNGDVGMHDASWRGTFGGGIYKRSGSHGCVNLPYSAAKTIYEGIEAGYPVLVYELPGTESPAELAQDSALTVDEAIETIGNVTLDSAGVIASARAQYNALSESAKSYVKKLDTLNAAEIVLSQLQGQANAQAQDAADRQAADGVINEINALPQNVTAAEAGAVSKARADYNALSDGAKGKVPQDVLDKLSAAEAALSQPS